MKQLLPFLSILLFTSSVLGQGPKVLATDPVPQSMVKSPTETIVVSFDQSIDESSVTQDTFRVFGRWSGPMDGTFSFENNSSVVKFIPLRDFFYGEWIRVSLSSGIQNNNSDPLEGGYSFNYWTKSLPASLDLEFGGKIDMRQSGEGTITCYGAYAGDVNNDEFSDLVVVTEDSDDIRILISDGNMNYEPFIVIEMPADQGPSTNEGADFNRDGLIDMAIGSTYTNTINVLMGDPVTHFGNQTSYVSDEGVRGLAVGDFDGDGWDDIATANRAASNISLFFNDGTGSFGPAVYVDTNFAGETSIAATDLNDDGYVDLLVGAYDHNRVISLINNGTGNFSVHATALVGNGPWMIAIGDINGDGFADVATANRFTDDVSIVMTDGTGGFETATHYPTNSFVVAIDLGDVDGDGDLDFISSNVIGGDYTLMENDGSGNFINPRVYPSIENSACAIIHDRNNDGAMDITMIDEAADVVLLYNNTMILDSNQLGNETGLTLYPNPFHNKIHLVGSISHEINFTLFDPFGRIILQQTVSPMAEIDLSGLVVSNGMYFAQLQQNNRTQTVKLFKK